MVTSSNGCFCVTGPLKGIFLSPLDYHNKEPITRALCFSYINLNKWFNKQPMIPLAMALMWRHCNGNAVYNLSYKSRNYLFNMIMLPMRECWFLFKLARKYSWTNSGSGGDFRPSSVVILLTKLRRGRFIRPRVIYHNWFPLELKSLHMFPLLLACHVIKKKVKLPVFRMPWRSCGVRVIWRCWIWLTIAYAYTCI